MIFKVELTMSTFIIYFILFYSYIVLYKVSVIRCITKSFAKFKRGYYRLQEAICLNAKSSALSINSLKNKRALIKVKPGYLIITISNNENIIIIIFML